MTTPTNKQIIDFILARFNESELKLFVISYFPEAENAWGSGMNKNDKIIELLAYCRRRDLMDNLLISLEQERPNLFQKTFPKRTKATQILPQSQADQDTFFHEKTGLEFVRVAAGEFKYDDKNETRTLPEYWISKTPVTQAVYKRFMDANPKHDVPYRNEDWAKPYNWDQQKRTHPAKKAEHPVVLVSWIDAVAFCKWAGLQLATEEQWEKAARGTDGRKFPWATMTRRTSCVILKVMWEVRLLLENIHRRGTACMAVWI
jgi:formylglycine-generating enzyme required for sulfatase activity